MRFHIGELASAAGVSPHTVRYYEKLKLLPRANRTYAGYRLYSEEDVRRLRFIKQAQTIGFSLEEIKQILLGGGAGLEECQRIRDLLCSKLTKIDEWLAEMRVFREGVATYLAECEEALGGRRVDCCPVISELAQATVAEAVPESASDRRGRREKAQADKSASLSGGLPRRFGGSCCESLLQRPSLDPHPESERPGLGRTRDGSALDVSKITKKALDLRACSKA